eukprot:tig00020603_g11756.t1
MVVEGLARAISRAARASKQAFSFGAFEAPPSSIQLFSFADAHALASWKLSSDKRMGGFSEAAAEHNAQAQAARFFGTTSLELGPKMSKSGFCSMTADLTLEQRREMHEADANALVIRCTAGDGRRYTFSVIPGHMMAGDVYSADIKPRQGAWSDIKIPVGKLVLMRAGSIIGTATDMDLGHVSGVTLSIQDGEDGPFELQVQSIRAIRDDNL